MKYLPKLLVSILFFIFCLPAFADDYNFAGGTGGGGGGGVSSISNSDNTITLSPNPITSTGTVSLNLTNANTWTGAQSFSTPGFFGGITAFNPSYTGLSISTSTTPIYIERDQDASTKLIVANANNTSNAVSSIILLGYPNSGGDTTYYCGLEDIPPAHHTATTPDLAGWSLLLSGGDTAGLMMYADNNGPINISSGLVGSTYNPNIWINTNGPSAPSGKTGFVGINNSSPQYQLDVTGQIQASNQLIFSTTGSVLNLNGQGYLNVAADGATGQSTMYVVGGGQGNAVGGGLILSSGRPNGYQSIVLSDHNNNMVFTAANAQAFELAAGGIASLGNLSPKTNVGLYLPQGLVLDGTSGDNTQVNTIYTNNAGTMAIQGGDTNSAGSGLNLWAGSNRDTGVLITGRDGSPAYEVRLQANSSTVATFGVPSGNSTTSNFWNLTGTLPSSLSAQTQAILVDITPAGNSSQNIVAFHTILESGYTGANLTAAHNANNNTSGTGNALFGSTLNGNFGYYGTAFGTTTGANIGYSSFPGNGNINVGFLSNAITAKNSAANIGGIFNAYNSGTSPTYTAIYGGLNLSSTPTFTNSVCTLNDGGVAVPSLLCQANGTTYLTANGNISGSSSTSNFLNVTGTLPSTTTAQTNGLFNNITSAGSSSQQQIAFQSSLAAGYTGSASTLAIYGTNNAAGTGTSAASGSSANYGQTGFAGGTTTGDNIGIWGGASGGNRNYGIAGYSVSSKNSAANIGGCFQAVNGGTSPTYVGVYAGLTTGTPTFANSALQINNGSVSAPVLLCQVNGTTNVSVDATGQLLAGTNGKFIINTTGIVSTYNNIATAGIGHATIYGAGRSTAQTGANASVATYTVGASDASFLVSANVNVTASTTNSFTTTCTYTDETNTSRTLTLTFSNAAGTLLTTITNVTGTGAYEGVPLHIRAKASTSITIATTGTFTSVTYNAEGIITQLQ